MPLLQPSKSPGEAAGNSQADPCKADPISHEFHCWVMGFFVFRYVLIRDKHAVWGHFLTVFQYKMMMVVVAVMAEMYLSTKAMFSLFYLIQLAC